MTGLPLIISLYLTFLQHDQLLYNAPNCYFKITFFLSFYYILSAEIVNNFFFIIYDSTKIITTMNIHYMRKTRESWTVAIKSY